MIRSEGWVHTVNPSAGLNGSLGELNPWRKRRKIITENVWCKLYLRIRKSNEQLQQHLSSCQGSLWNYQKPWDQNSSNWKKSGNRKSASYQKIKIL